MIGNASIIKLINRDENLHGGFTRFLLKIEENPDEGFSEIAKKNVKKLFIKCGKTANEEIEW
jgi:ribonucleotide reductase beta subunit family protein with ferritin-like domain